MKSFTQLVGSTTAGANPGSFADLTQNNSSVNVALGGVLCDDQHRYLIQKYFDNERTYTTITIGAEDLTLTGALISGATSATLTSSWTDITCQQLVVFSNSEQRTVIFTQGSTNIFWQTGLTSSATVDISTIGVQAYPIPANVSKIKNDTITVGQLVYTPAPVQSIQEWTMLNALPYTSDIPAYFYIYQNQVMFWPIPSTSGNIITFNYKARVPNLSYADYATGTIAGTVGSNSITGTATSWNATGGYALNTDLSFANLYIKATPPKGDGFWYPIQRFTTDTALTLNLPVAYAPSLSGSSYIIGQFPLLQEDFHDMIVYGALLVYFGSIKKDTDQYKLYEALYMQKLNLLEAYAGTKSVNVDLGAQPIPSNPNLFLFAPPNP
jgi:hypothetical protein